MQGTQRVLVTGATGKQGGSTVDALLAKGGFEVFALTRNSSSRAAVALEQKGAKLVVGDVGFECARRNRRERAGARTRTCACRPAARPSNDDNEG